MIKLVKRGKGVYFVDSGLPGLSAGVTGREINSTDYSLSDDEIRKAEKVILNSVTGIISRRIVMLNQVHGDRIIHVVGDPSSDLSAVGEADGLITAIPGVMLVIRTADCVPVILYDARSRVLGAVHSGWKGTMLNIAGKCVRDIKIIYGSDPGDITAFMLPSIGPDSYEVNEDVAGYFPDTTIRRNGRLYVNLWASVEASLAGEGVRKERIFNSGICNRINHVEFFSHRFGDKGRNLNFACMK